MPTAIKRALLFSALALVVLAGVLMMVFSQGSRTTIAPSMGAGPAASQDDSYTVNLSPAGDVRFTHVPQKAVTQDANYNDMLVALRQEQKLTATGYRDNFHDEFYRAIEGLQVHYDPSKLAYLAAPGAGMFDKELLYSLKPDVFHIDPSQLASSRGWSRADVDEIARNVAPFIANRYSRDNSSPGTDPYTYYTVWELSEKIGEVYRRPEPIRELKKVYDDLVRNIQAKLPAEDKRPRVGLVYYNNGKFTTYALANQGFGQAQYRDVGARDAFTSISDRAYGGKGGGITGTPLDAEGLLALNPDVLIMPFALYPGAAHASFEQMAALKSDPLLQKVNAFRDGRLYPGGTPLQGPLFYLFQIEMAAKQIYPEIFGAFDSELKYPVAEQLFDRARLARILAAAEDSSHDGH